MHLARPDIVAPLVQWLTIGDVFRLRRALGKDMRNAWTIDVRAMLTRRVGLRVNAGRRIPSIAELGTLVQLTRRCVECGVRTRCKLRVCLACIADPLTPVALITRQSLRDWCKTHGIRDCLVRSHLSIGTFRVVKKDRVGRHYYWRRDALAIAASLN
jgi:hypothetical protein